jgi:chitosanase
MRLWKFGRAVLLLVLILGVFLLAAGIYMHDSPEIGNETNSTANISGNNSSNNLSGNNSTISDPQNNTVISGNNSTIPLNHSCGENSAYGLDSEKKLRAEQLTSLFENNNLTLQYGYAEALGDGRGITCGRAGFTTGTGDAYAVVKLYTERKLENSLAKYLPELERLNSAEDSGDTSRLNGFIEDWKIEANDPIFRQAQDEINDRLYYRPAMDYAKNLCVTSALGKAILYDTIIQHGNGDDLDSLPALLKRTEGMAGGTPKTGINEAVWLSDFLSVRRNDLAHAYDAETRQEWAKSVSRVDVFMEILNVGNLDLKGPIEISNKDYEGAVIP